VVAAAAAAAEGGEGALEKSVTTRAVHVYTLVSKTTSLTRGKKRAVLDASAGGGGRGA